MRVIAIDPGLSRLGYAVGEKPNKLLETGTFYAQKDKMQQVVAFIQSLINKYVPQCLVIEDYRIYNTSIKKKHTTPEVIGAIKTLCISNGIEYELTYHNEWKAKFNRIYFCIHDRLDESWKNALQKGSEHSRDAVMMLLPHVVSLYHWNGG